jgi:hypothetical protein
MPEGDRRSAAEAPSAARVKSIPRRSPTPAGELERIKNAPDPAPAPEGPPDSDAPSRAAPEALLKNCLTNDRTGFTPSDIHGAVNATRLIVVTNSDIGIFRKSDCATLSFISLRTFFSQNGGFNIPAAETLFDPNVVFDRLSNRCIVTVESRNDNNTDQFLYIAASTNAGCTQWRRIRFELSRGNVRFCKEAVSDFYDYPHAGYNIRRLVVTANNFRTNDTCYGSVISIHKPALYSGATVNAVCFRNNLPCNLAPAIVGDNNASMFILSPGSGGGSVITRRRLVTAAGGVGGDTLAATANINVTAWTAAPNAAQPNGQRLDTLDGRFQSATKQIGTSLWNVHAVKVGSFSRARIYKFSTTGTNPLFVFTPVSDTQCNCEHRFNPSIDTNSAAGSATAFMTSTRTIPSKAGPGKAAHLISFGPNSSGFGWDLNVVATSPTQYTNDGNGNSCNTVPIVATCRWGDYSATQIDPSNTARAWGFNQLIRNGSVSGAGSHFNWNTRAGMVGP